MRWPLVGSNYARSDRMELGDVTTDERILPLLCDPDTHDALELDTGALLNSKSGRRYAIRDGIPVFFEALSGSNKKYQEL